MTNAELLERDRAHHIHPIHDRELQRAGRVWVKGRGATLVDADGKEFIDGLAGLWNVAVGHGRPELAEAARVQMETLAFASGFQGSTNPRAVELAERLAALTYPSINHFFFTSGGGEATESSIKAARSYWKLTGKPDKTKVVSRQHGYHGLTLAGMSATGISTFWPLFEPRVPGFIHIPSPYPYRYVAPPDVSQGVAAANELEQAILREGPETVAMFLAEPVQGAGGVIVPPDDYFPRVREICDRYDVLFVADEVITAFGRTGTLFALDHWNVEPDILQFAKAVTSGYFPLGGIGVNDRIAEAIGSAQRPWMHAFTYSAHPVGCAVALANLDILIRENLPRRAADRGRRLLGGLTAALGSHPHVGDIRGKGLMSAVEFVQDRETKTAFPADRAIGQRVHEEAERRGLFSRVRGDIFMLAPPLVITESEVDRIVEILAGSVRAVLG